MHTLSFVLCFSVLVTVVILKFAEGAWVTLFVTGVLIIACLLIHRHYQRIRAKLHELNAALGDMLELASAGETTKAEAAHARSEEADRGAAGECLQRAGHSYAADPAEDVSRASSSRSISPRSGVLDSGNFKGVEEVAKLRHDRQQTIDKFVLLARTLGLEADGEYTLGTDPVAESAHLCFNIRQKFPRSVFFAGKLLFEAEKWYYPLLHNETAYAITRRLQLQGIPMVVMPIRILKFGR